jgi:hypothetical protein
MKPDETHTVPRFVVGKDGLHELMDVWFIEVKAKFPAKS